MNSRLQNLADSIPVIDGVQHTLLARSADGVYYPQSWQPAAAASISDWLQQMSGRIGVEHVPKELLSCEGLEEAETFHLVGESGCLVLVAVKEGIDANTTGAA